MQNVWFRRPNALNLTCRIRYSQRRLVTRRAEFSRLKHWRRSASVDASVASGSIARLGRLGVCDPRAEGMFVLNLFHDIQHPFVNQRIMSLRKRLLTATILMAYMPNPKP